MSKLGLAVGLTGIIALALATDYAMSRADAVTIAPVRSFPSPRERVRVEVLNAGGVTGRAREATQELRDIGFDVVHFGNADRFDRDSSVVLDRVGRPDLARAVSEALGVQAVTTELDPNLFVDVTVLLGREWTGSHLRGPMEDSVPKRERWDPRGWIGR